MPLSSIAVTSVRDLLAEDLRVPRYQRPYAWELANALELLDDIVESFHRKAGQYAIGSVILCRVTRATGFHIEVVDGQQRLLTLTMLLAALRGQSIDMGPDANIASRVVKVQQGLAAAARAIDRDTCGRLLSYVEQNCVIVRIETDDPDEAFRFFDSQNYRGKALRPHDLLKSYHLREMRDESPASKTAVVERWEETDDAELEAVFARYLFRIAKWSRGERAGTFTTREIGEFKGLSPSLLRTPAAAYHLAAQLAVPPFSAWAQATAVANGSGVGKLPSDLERASGRARFQLDAPIIAGRHFFEMVGFMLREVRDLDSELFPQGCGHEERALDRTRYREDYRHRFIAEMYLCAMLYYTNKFGDRRYDDARQHLLAWAYTLRLDYERVSWMAVDRYAVEGGTVRSDARHRFNVFGVLRRSLTGDELLRLPLDVPPEARQSRDEELAELVREIAGG